MKGRSSHNISGIQRILDFLLHFKTTCASFAVAQQVHSSSPCSCSPFLSLLLLSPPFLSSLLSLQVTSAQAYETGWQRAVEGENVELQQLRR